MTIKPLKKQNQNNDDNKLQHDNGGVVVVVGNGTNQQTRNNRVNCLNHNHVGVQQNHSQNNVQRGEKRNIGQVYDDGIHNRLHRRQQTNSNNLRTINKKRDQQQQQSQQSQQQHYNHIDNQNTNNNNILTNDNSNANNINIIINNDNNNILPLNGSNNNNNNNHNNNININNNNNINNNVATVITENCSNNNSNKSIKNIIQVNNNNNLNNMNNNINNNSNNINNINNNSNNNNNVIVNTNKTNIVVLPGCSNNNNINNNININKNDEHDVITGYNSGDEHISKREDILTQNEWHERDKEFMKSMLKCGLIVKEIAEDGACLFRAISLQIYGDEDMHENIRKQTMDYIYQNREYFAQFVTEDINQYINRKRELSAHGNHIEIQAMSELYNRPILLYCYKTDPYNIFNSEQLNNGYDPLRLSYQRCSHYNAIIDPYKSSVGVGLGLAGYRPDEFQHKDLNDAVLLSEQIEIEQTMFEDKLKTTDWEETNKVIEEEIARESYREYYSDSLKRTNISSTITSSSAKAIDKQDQLQSTNVQSKIDNDLSVAGCSGLTAGPSGLHNMRNIKIYPQHNKNYNKSSKKLLKKKLNHRGFIKKFSKNFDTINAKKKFTTKNKIIMKKEQPIISTTTTTTSTTTSEVAMAVSISPIPTAPTPAATPPTTTITLAPVVPTVITTTATAIENEDDISFNYVHKIRKNCNIYKLQNNMKESQNIVVEQKSIINEVTPQSPPPRIRIVPIETLQNDNNNTQITINNSRISSFYQSLLDSAYYNNSDEIGTEENMIQQALEESRRSYLESLKVNCLFSGTNICDEDDSSSP